MTFLFYFLNVATSAGQSALGKKYAINGGNASVFNINKALAGISAFLLLGLWNGLSFHVPTCLYGVGYGISLCISMHTGFRALSMGPMALTSIIASFSLIIPFIFSITVWGEAISVYAIIGLLFLLIAIVLLNVKKEESDISFKWFVYAFLTLLANGVCSVIQKYHQIYFPKMYRIEFMIFALLCVLIILTITQTATPNKRAAFQFSATGLIAGVMNGVANYSVLYLAAAEKASVLFPVISVANVITTWGIGKLVFKEHLKPLQLCGLTAGVIAIFLLNL